MHLVSLCVCPLALRRLAPHKRPRGVNYILGCYHDFTMILQGLYLESQELRRPRKALGEVGVLGSPRMLHRPSSQLHADWSVDSVRVPTMHTHIHTWIQANPTRASI